MTTLLSVRNVSAGYGDITVISDLSVTVSDAEIVTLVGANGSGKSTFLKALAGVVPITSGAVAIGGTDITFASPRERVFRGMSLVPEGRELFWSMTVEENLEVAIHASGKGDMRVSMLKLAFSLFPRLEERRNQRAETMSGGEQQMLAIARALMVQPKVIMLDEPSAGLAPGIVRDVVERLEEIRRSGTAVLLVEQDVTLALRVCDRAYVLDRGVVVAEGSGAQIRDDPRLMRSYLGI